MIAALFCCNLSTIKCCTIKTTAQVEYKVGADHPNYNRFNKILTANLIMKIYNKFDALAWGGYI